MANAVRSKQCITVVHPGDGSRASTIAISPVGRMNGRGMITEKPTSIADLRIDQPARVARLSGPVDLCRRLGEMGLTAGSAVRVVRTAPFGGPIEINLRNYHLCLRREEGRCVLVECSNDPADCDACALQCSADLPVMAEGATAAPRRRWMRYLGAGAFMFFAIKGLLWLLVPLALVWWRYISE